MTLRLTGHAIRLLLLSLAMGLAGIVYQAPALVLISGVAPVALLLDAAFVVAARPNAALAVSPQRLEEGQSAKVEVTAKRLRPGQQIQVPLAAPLALTQGTNVVSRPKGPVVFEVTTNVRGAHEIGPPAIRTWGPVRLWATEDHVGAAVTVEVMPRPQDASAISLRSRVVTPVQGRFQVNRPGQGFDFFTLREYRSGDTMRSVNWKATARRDDDLIVNQRQIETHGELTILLDARAVTGLGLAGQTPLDFGCRAALGLFADALGQRDTVHFVAYGREAAELPNLRQDRLSRMEEMLARLEASGNTSSATAWAHIRRRVRSSSGPVVLITTAEADATLAETVRTIVSRGHALTIVSPTPEDTALDPTMTKRRARARAATISRLRDLGASVVDWKGGHLEAEAPARKVNL